MIRVCDKIELYIINRNKKNIAKDEETDMFWKKKTQKLYDSKMNLIDKNNITNLRERVKILVVDDEDDNIVKPLQARRYNVFYKDDMTYAVEAEPFDIVFLDIKGVAKRLQSSMEGFQLAKEIKLKYPLKQVYCYSSTTTQSIIAEELAEKKIDGFIMKDTEIDKWCEKLDRIIQDCVNLEKQWEIIRTELLQNHVKEGEIEIIKKMFFAGFKDGKFDNLYPAIIGSIKNAPAVLSLLSGIMDLMKILIV